MALGQARQRKLLDFGLSYSRRIWEGRTINFQYFAEVRAADVSERPGGAGDAHVPLDKPTSADASGEVSAERAVPSGPW